MSTATDPLANKFTTVSQQIIDRIREGREANWNFSLDGYGSLALWFR